jgi:2-polyprenyl-3-methyl-5-hydroxy-6-metoxy-1,4-benzoquinol methylase
MENIDYARKIANGKKTLDIGCMGTNQKAEKFNQLSNTSYLVGVDVTAPNTESLMYCNIENFKDVKQVISYHGKFEVIVMLEVIEHLGNMYGVLSNLRNLLVNNGIIVLSTPNALSEK